MIKTHEGGVQHEHSLDHAVEFFSKAGSLFEKRDNFYAGSESALSLFQKTWIVDKAVSMQLLLWLRDCRGGAGNRSGFRACLKWLCQHDPEWVNENIGWIPLIGRWDDLRCCFGTKAEEDAVQLWIEGLNDSNVKVLAAKWAKRNDKQLSRALRMNEASFRKFLSKIRKDHIVEAKMCTNRWTEIDYSTVPSVAMARYTNAFKKHDILGLNAFKEKLVKGEEIIHSSVLFPHDCVRTSMFGDGDIATAQFDALPNYLEGTIDNIMVIADTCDSMNSIIGGKVRAVDVSQGMALYCSSRYPTNSPFYKKFISFCSEAKLTDWGNFTFDEAVHSYKIFNRAIGSTRIDVALDTILETAKFWSLKQEQIPNVLLIISDMQFHDGTGDYRINTKATIEVSIKRWNDAGYETPKIIYWNTAGYVGNPATVDIPNVGLVSGFSPAILKSIFASEDFSPKGIMLKALEKYKINVPK